MIDSFDAALSDFIDSLPEEPASAYQLLEEAAPFSGHHGDLPELAKLATMLRAVPSYEARPEWMAATKARLMAAPVLPPEKRGLTWLGTMFLPLTQITFPSRPKLTMPSPVFARAAVAMALMVTLRSMAVSGSIDRSPLLQVTGQQGPVAEAEQAISAIEQQLSLPGAGSSTRDIVLLSKQLELADDAIDQAPPAAQPRLRAQLQNTVRAVRFDGTLEAILGPSTIEIDGVAIQADPAVVQQLRAGQRVSLQVTVTGTGKLQAVQVAPLPPLASTSGSGAIRTNAGTSNSSTAGSASGPPAGGAPSQADGSAGAAQSTSATGPQTLTTGRDGDKNDSDSSSKQAKTTDVAKTDKTSDVDARQDTNQDKGSSGDAKVRSFGALTVLSVDGDRPSPNTDRNASSGPGSPASASTPTNSSSSSGQTSTNGDGNKQNSRGPSSAMPASSSAGSSGSNNDSGRSSSSGSASTGNSGKSNGASASTGSSSSPGASSGSSSTQGKRTGKSSSSGSTNSSSKGDNSNKQK